MLGYNAHRRATGTEASWSCEAVVTARSSAWFGAICRLVYYY